MKVLLVLVAFIAACYAAPKRVGVEMVPMIKLMKATKVKGNLGFSYSNCAAGADLNIKKLTVGPDPIVIPGEVTVELDAGIATEITNITSAELVVKKKIFGVYIEIPCVDNVGSCTYNDICTLLEPIQCPKELTDLGFRCQCPFPAKEFNVPSTSFEIPKLPIPSSLEDGDYDIKVTLKNGDTVLACYDFQASLKAASKSTFHNDVEIVV